MARVDPSSCLPPEVMGYIFELSYTPSRSGFLFAVILAQVSRRWRSMAIGTPSLWRRLAINLRRETPDIVEFWHCMRERVNGVPPILTLRSIGEGDGSALAACRLTSFPTISSLNLVIKCNNYTDHILSQNFPSLTSVEHLELVVDSPTQHVKWNCDILGKFPEIKNLTLFGFGHPFRAHAGLQKIQHLEAYNMPSWEFIPYLRHFKNLLSIHLGLIFSTHARAVVLPLVHTMKVSHSESWILALECPKLKKLEVDLICPTVTGWIEGHGSIETIWVKEVGDWKALAAAAPQLLYLSVNSLPESLGGFELFPELEGVTAGDANGIVQSFPK